MTEKTNLVKVFSGSEIAVNLLQEELEQVGVYSIIQNEFNSGIVAGFAASTSSAIDLFIQECDMEKAEDILKSF